MLIGICWKNVLTMLWFFIKTLSFNIQYKIFERNKFFDDVEPSLEFTPHTPSVTSYKLSLPSSVNHFLSFWSYNGRRVMKVNLGVETYVQAQGDFGKVYDSTFKILYWTVPSWILDNLSGFMFEVANKVLQTNQHLTFFLELFHASAWNSKLMIFINVGKRLFYKYVAKMK